jgi:hypothetical protein
VTAEIRTGTGIETATVMMIERSLRATDHTGTEIMSLHQDDETETKIAIETVTGDETVIAVNGTATTTVRTGPRQTTAEDTPSPTTPQPLRKTSSLQVGPAGSTSKAPAHEALLPARRMSIRWSGRRGIVKGC